ncbi:MAG: antitoxin family protein [Anaerolineae bacterium]|nr:antitoxin family protein [Anaerolineae bacterium]
MLQRVRAVYRGGTFILQEPFDLPEESEVELVVQGPLVLSPVVTDPGERKRILEAVIARMQKNPITLERSYLTREALHERR